MKPHIFHPEAGVDYSEAAQFYARINPALANRFYDEIERLIRDVRQQPDRFRLYDPPVRRHLSDTFPFALLYVEQPDHIWIVAIMHLKRKPGYWKERLR